jgi:hypothetical protein
MKPYKKGIKIPSEEDFAKMKQMTKNEVKALWDYIDVDCSTPCNEAIKEINANGESVSHTVCMNCAYTIA